MAPVRDHSGKTIFVEPIYYAPYTRTIVAYLIPPLRQPSLVNK